jgi:hypothetical protein
MPAIRLPQFERQDILNKSAFMGPGTPTSIELCMESLADHLWMQNIEVG